MRAALCMLMSGFLVALAQLLGFAAAPFSPVGEEFGAEAVAFLAPPTVTALLLLLVHRMSLSVQAAAGIGALAVLCVVVGSLAGLSSSTWATSRADPALELLMAEVTVGLLFLLLIGAMSAVDQLREGRNRRRAGGAGWGRDYRVGLSMAIAGAAVFAYACAQIVRADAGESPVLRNPAEPFGSAILFLWVPAIVGGALTLLVRGRHVVLQMLAALAGHVGVNWIFLICEVNLDAEGSRLGLLSAYLAPIYAVLMLVVFTVISALSETVEVSRSDPPDLAVWWRRRSRVRTMAEMSR